MSFTQKFEESTSTLYVTGNGPILGPLTEHKSDTIKIYVINNTFSQIAESCFSSYSLLNEIQLPDSIIQIGNNIISGCNSLTSLTLPKKVKTISADQSFDWTYSLQNIFVSPDNPYFCDIDGCLYSKDKTILYFVPGGRPERVYYVPFSVKTIYHAAFSHSNILQTIVVPPTVKRFEHYIGFSSKMLTSILIFQCKSLIYVDLTTALHSTDYADNPEAIIHYSPFCIQPQRTCFKSKLFNIYKTFFFVQFMIIYDMFNK